MQSIPYSVVPKPHSDKLRLVIDQSAEPYSLNSLIPKCTIYVPLDDLHLLGEALRCARTMYGAEEEFVLFKSNVSAVYRCLLVHVLWQVQQVLRIAGMLHVDCCNNFGNRGAGWAWGCFISLVIWIGVVIKLLADLLAYVDDNFSWELAQNHSWYAPYQKYLPSKQCHLLQLWDELGIPHEEQKQEYGPVLTIIGFEVDANAMTVTMPTSSKAELTQAV
jgi:hypothetical protein